ncbi:UNVERIFIED_CONTAM: hypothetical protein K2H54_014050 [Gekko kuhli]
MHSKQPVSLRPPSLLSNLARKISWLTARTTRARRRSQSQEGNRGPAKQDAVRKESSPEDVVKSLIDDVFLSLLSFAEEVLESEGPLGGAQEQHSLTEGKEWHCHTHEVPTTGKQVTRACEALEKERTSSQDTFPIQETVSCLLRTLSIQLQSTHEEVQKNSVKQLLGRPSGKRELAKPGVVEDALDQIAERIEEEVEQLEHDEGDCTLVTREFTAYVAVTETQSALQPEDVAADISRGTFWRGCFPASWTPCLSATRLVPRESLTSRSPCVPILSSLGEDLLQSILNKILSFAASYYKEALPSSSQLEANRGSTQPEASNKAHVEGNFSETEFYVYSRCALKTILGDILEEFRHEESHLQFFLTSAFPPEKSHQARKLTSSILASLNIAEVDQWNANDYWSRRRFEGPGFLSARESPSFKGMGQNGLEEISTAIPAVSPAPCEENGLLSPLMSGAKHKQGLT